jgi:hypothetical protein
MRLVAVPLALSFALASVLGAGSALAQEDDAKKAPAKAAEQEPSYGHRGQVGVRAGLVGGYRMIFSYDESPYCADPDPQKSPKDQQKFCGHGAPLAIDLALSYALLDSIEPYLWARFGLASESETHTDPVIILGAGSRIYTMSDSAFKIFIEPALGFEIEGGDGPLNYLAKKPEYQTDIVFHLAAGPQFDLAKNFGIYADAGMTTGILRSIHSTLELQLGLQGRIP